ncbi:MAG: ABC transporter ATP-binding protein, partial [Oscillospiraceae bacterium]|nr:ABC transporter ATP-binding protein [Oscillospiraceae bacterium]
MGSLAAYLNYVKQVSQPINQISHQTNTILAAAAGAERIFSIMEQPGEIDEGKYRLVNVEKAEDGTLSECEHRSGHWAWRAPDGALT